MRKVNLEIKNAKNKCKELRNLPNADSIIERDLASHFQSRSHQVAPIDVCQEKDYFS